MATRLKSEHFNCEEQSNFNAKKSTNFYDSFDVGAVVVVVDVPLSFLHCHDISNSDFFLDQTEKKVLIFWNKTFLYFLHTHKTHTSKLSYQANGMNKMEIL